MSEAVRIRRNSIFSGLSITSRLIANVFVFWIMARYYGPESFGQFTSAQVLAANFIFFADFGLDVLLTTEIARNRKNAVQLFQQFASLKFVFSIFALIVMWSISFMGYFSQETSTLILILSFYMFFSTLTNFLSALYKGFELLEYETKVSLFINIGLLIIALPLIFFRANIIVIALAYVFTRVLGFILSVIYAYKVLPQISFKLAFSNFHQIKNKVIVFGLFCVFNNLFFQLDTNLLSILKGDREAGIYQAVFKLIMLPLVVPDILSNALIPLLSRLHGENNNQWVRIGSIMNKILISIILPISIILFFYSEQIIFLIYGSKDYVSAVPILKIFAITLFIRFATEVHAIMLTTSERQKIRLFVVMVATILNIALNYLIIPHYGAYGAAYVSLLTNSFVGLCYYYSNRYVLRGYVINRQMLYLFLITISVIYITYLGKEINIFISAVLVFAIWFVCMYYFFYSKKERKVIFSNELGFNLFKK